MAETSQRYQDNVAGKFYVDKSCIDCGLCSEIAPSNFCRSKQQDHDVVYKQPSTNLEEQECIQAFDNCPVEAIGLDSRQHNIQQ